MNIKTFAVVKCWVLKKTSTPRASGTVLEPRGVSREGWQQCFGGKRAVPHRWVCQVRASQEMLGD